MGEVWEQGWSDLRSWNWRTWCWRALVSLVIGAGSFFAVRKWGSAGGDADVLVQLGVAAAIATIAMTLRVGWVFAVAPFRVLKARVATLEGADDAVRSPAKAKPGPRRAPPEYQMHALTQVIAELSKHSIDSISKKEFVEALASTKRGGTDQRFEPLTWASVTIGLRGLQQKGVLRRIDTEWGDTAWEWDL